MILNRHIEKLTAADPTTIGTVGTAGGGFARLLLLRAANYADDTKAGGGTDTTQKIKITDANSNIIYLDASARDYTTEVVLRVLQDDTTTGLGITPVDTTGAAITAGGGAEPIGELPWTVVVTGGGTATDYFAIDVVYEV